ncbi:PREDICTED: gibberellin 2-beta-dioxygenase 8-like [Nelumbo nucifera]|uniref:gibberellin 2beta-dioxygenase n=2 Tax=Nelumbo nucifera TaxID=4432 RepID=A0A1U7Z1D7_NELNU|nr:PREDICTED: gibberellin 2-beta-dioxygenase 8-like [Nelumbo nucifera]XP_010240928.1 PREDICTED: gibberellin 2-beta-dioxygenase 8-like [Nelumbo nucifera]DAD20578.1 TPA_asm: hypothetical protein HUJ06_022041 [Nelumbo nucifera]
MGVEDANVFETLTKPLRMDADPPFEETYKTLFQNSIGKATGGKVNDIIEECELPVIDLSGLNRSKSDREKCKREIAEASAQWGFFQAVNHGIPREILERMHHEQVKLFQHPFDKKASKNLLNFSVDSYRWGTPSATCLRQFSWSEAFHIPLTDISKSVDSNSLSSTIKEYEATVSVLAQSIAAILAENLGVKSNFFAENCLPSTCYLRMNRYPPCPISSEVFGLMPHTDSDFLTILYQDQVGGLQLVKDGRWITVKPNPDALIVNIGDLFEAWSNGVYKSVQHRVMTNRQVQRFSVAYFFCPSYDTVIQSCREPSLYRKFNFREYRQQVQEDVRARGYKIGLPRFLLRSQLG